MGVGDYADSSILRKLEFKYWDKIKSGEDFEKIIGKKKYKLILKKMIYSTQDVLKKIKSFNKPTKIIFGNSDVLNNEVKKYKLKGLESQCNSFNIKLLKRKKEKIKGFMVLAFSGYRGALYKRLTKFDKKQQTEIKKVNLRWGKKLKKLFKGKIDFNKTIFLAHDVPYGFFDKVKFKGHNPLNGKHVGDEYLVKFIKKYQPKVFICGHMHEYQGTKKLGKTLIITTGASVEGKAAIIDFPQDKKSKIKVKFIK